MRTALSVFCLVLALSVASPAQAQFRQDVQQRPAEARVYDENAFQATLDKVFSPEHFKMGHTYEMSYSSFGGEGAAMGAYTNSMMWQFNNKLAARVDVSLMQPLSGNLYGDSQSPRLMLRNAEVAYRPSENMTLHFQIQQSPYGAYGAPYGYSPYGYRSRSNAFNAQFSSAPGSLFWNDDLSR